MFMYSSFIYQVAIYMIYLKAVNYMYIKGIFWIHIFVPLYFNQIITPVNLNYGPIMQWVLIEIYLTSVRPSLKECLLGIAA